MHFMSVKPSPVARVIGVIEAELAKMKDEVEWAKGARKAELKKLIAEAERVLEKLRQRVLH
jgi:hypothetical protein